MAGWCLLLKEDESERMLKYTQAYSHVFTPRAQQKNQPLEGNIGKCRCGRGRDGGGAEANGWVLLGGCQVGGLKFWARDHLRAVG